MFQIHPKTHLILLVMLLPIGATTPAVAGDALEGAAKHAVGALDQTRWGEHAYGLSLRPPLHAQLLQRIGGDVVPWQLGGGVGPAQIAIQPIGTSLHLARIRRDLRQGPVEKSKELQQLQGKATDEQVDDASWAKQSNQRMLSRIEQQTQLRAQGQAWLLSQGQDDTQLLIQPSPSSPGPAGYAGLPDAAYTLRLAIKHLPQGQHINKVLTAAIHDIAQQWPSAILLKQQPITLAQRPSHLLIFKIPPPRSKPHQGPSIISQAWLPINDKTFALLQLQTPFVFYEDHQALFLAVLESIQITDPLELAKQRKVLLAKGEAWLKNIDPKALLKSVPTKQLFRIVQNQTDLGYLTITTQPTAQLGLPGIGVVVGARLYQGQYAIDTASQFFLAYDQTHEIWDINTTAHTRGKQVNAAAKQSWVETGLRFGDRIQVRRDEKPYQIWQRPQVYVSLVEQHLLEKQLSEKFLAEGKPLTLAYYAYLPSKNKIAYRTVRVEEKKGSGLFLGAGGKKGPDPFLRDGGCLVYTRVSPEMGESVSQYDASGKLVGRLLPGGRWLVATNAKELKRIWGKN